MLFYAVTYLQLLSLCSVGAIPVLGTINQQQPETVSIMKQIKIHGLLLVRVLCVCVCVCVCDIGHCDHLTIPLCIVVSMCISTNH